MVSPHDTPPGVAASGAWRGAIDFSPSAPRCHAPWQSRRTKVHRYNTARAPSGPPWAHGLARRPGHDDTPCAYSPALGRQGQAEIPGTLEGLPDAVADGDARRYRYWQQSGTTRDENATVGY